MNIIKYKMFESKKLKEYNDILKNMGVMDEKGNIDLKDMIEKISSFLSKDENKKKFLKEVDDDIKPEVDVKNIKIKAKKLKPSQDVIYLDHVLSRLVVNDYDREQILGGELKDHDILVSLDNHVIDGHHRWAAAFLLNPKCKMDVTQIQLPIEYALPILNALLKASDKITLGKSADYKVNMFDVKDWVKKRALQKMNTIITKTVKGGIDLGDDEKKKSEEAWKTNESLAGLNTDAAKPFYKNIKRKLKLDRHPLKQLRKNLKKMKSPESIFGDRKEMPQIKKKEAKELL